MSGSIYSKKPKISEIWRKKLSNCQIQINREQSLRSFCTISAQWKRWYLPILRLLRSEFQFVGCRRRPEIFRDTSSKWWILLAGAEGGQKIFVNTSAEWWILLFVGAEGGQKILVLSDGFYWLWRRRRPENFREYKFWAMDFTVLGAEGGQKYMRGLSFSAELISFPRLQYFCFGAGNSRKWVEWGEGSLGAKRPEKKSDFWIFKLAKKQTKILSFCAVWCFLLYMALL